MEASFRNHRIAKEILNKWNESDFVKQEVDIDDNKITVTIQCKPEVKFIDVSFKIENKKDEEVDKTTPPLKSQILSEEGI